MGDPKQHMKQQQPRNYDFWMFQFNLGPPPPGRGVKTLPGSKSQKRVSGRVSGAVSEGPGQQLFNFRSPAVHWMARTSSLNCLSCRNLYQTPHSLNPSPLFTENPFFSLKSASSDPLPKNRLLTTTFQNLNVPIQPPEVPRRWQPWNDDFPTWPSLRSNSGTHNNRQTTTIPSAQEHHPKTRFFIPTEPLKSLKKKKGKHTKKRKSSQGKKQGK